MANINETFAQALERFKKNKRQTCRRKIKLPKEIKKPIINPTLNAAEFSWDVISYLQNEKDGTSVKPKKNRQWVLTWLSPKGNLNVKAAEKKDLAVLKIISENSGIEKTSKNLNMPLLALNNIFKSAAQEHIIFMPESKIRRKGNFFNNGPFASNKYLIANTFVLQWHITNACDLNCKHCYDRTKRSPLIYKQGLKILRQLKDFCKKMNVKGHVCFTGGNPFLHKSFLKLYKDAAGSGFSTSILGNPVSKKRLEEILSIQIPGYFQVSLEGLERYNDYIRGKGHFKRSLSFLKLLKKMKVSSTVMLTLNKDNVDQIIPLAQKLKGEADCFTFNRLSRTGEGKNFFLPTQLKYKKFLYDYTKASKKNPMMEYKDNLINTVLSKNEKRVFDGCTGYGCGAAFNFVALLPDGQVHACRKFPSLIGNVLNKNLLSIYNSKKAQKYRQGTLACNGCSLRPVCGGCLAVTDSYGLNVFTQKDPHCFYRH
ncbi:MAG TPA: thio(seleno)oxazole modification radical SAM maturase SbtM [Elusimicrobiales bacterium]|nr:thio(seleno)oxazole modification radical SAM maturase SbtM [Elusimicrobiales bacterium]